jgi:SAM-dependent methyltransferase
MQSGVVECIGASVAPRFAPFDALEYDRHMLLERSGSHLRERVDPLLGRACHGSVLEVGCGTGRFLIAAAGRGWPIVGVDCDRGMLERAALRGLPNLVHASAERLPFRTGSFDSVVSAMAWCFVEDSAYGEIARVLKPGGRFAYQLRGKANARLYHLSWQLRGLFERPSRGAKAESLLPFRFFSGLRSEKELLKKHGLRCLDAATVAAPLRLRFADAIYQRAHRIWPPLAGDVIVTAEPL